jgi:hypothetical protein
MKSQNPAWRQHYWEKGRPIELGQNLRHNRLRAGSLSAAAATAVLRRCVVTNGEEDLNAVELYEPSRFNFIYCHMLCSLL